MSGFILIGVILFQQMELWNGILLIVELGLQLVWDWIWIIQGHCNPLLKQPTYDNLGSYYWYTG